MSRYLVTGGAGFLGRRVVERLRSAGHDVFVPRSRDYDLTEAGAVSRCFDAARPDVVIHAAAKVGGIGANRRYPGTFFRDNTLMGVHVVEACRQRGVAKLVVLGTICAYPKHTPVPFREEDLWSGYPEETNAPYGIAKKALLVMLQAYRQEFGLRGVYLLPVNLYGPGDEFDLERSHVIPALLRKLVEARERGEPRVVLWGDGTPTREFLYVDDAAEGIVAAAERFDGEEPVNLGSGVEVTIRELAGKVRELTGYGGEVVWDTAQPNGQPRRCLDTSRAERLFGWRARTPLDDGLARTLSWYLESRSGGSTASLAGGPTP